MDKEKDIERREGAAPAQPEAVSSKRHVFVWVAVALAVAAWFVLVWGNGYAAMVLAVLACVAGFRGASGSERSMKRLAIAAIIAAMVLVVVIAAFLIVIKVGLNT